MAHHFDYPLFIVSITKIYKIFCLGIVFYSTTLFSGIYGDTILKNPFKTKGSTIEEVIIYPQEHAESSSTIARKGVLFNYKNAKATVLICHGFMCDKYDVGILRKLFNKNQFNVMTFDFRAHGEEAKGQSCTFGRDEALDVIAAAKFLRNHPDLLKKPVFVYGFSMGAVSAIEAQSRDSSLFDAMILDCPFDSSERVIKRGLKHLKFTMLGYEFDLPGRNILQKYAFHPYVQSIVKSVLKSIANWDAQSINTTFCPIHPVESAKKITVPCLFIHCKNDQKVSIQQVKSVYDSVVGYKRFWLTDGRRHFDSFFYNPEKYTEQVRLFYNQVLSGNIYKNPREQLIIDNNDEATQLMWR